MKPILHNLYIRDFAGMAGRVIFRDELEEPLFHGSFLFFIAPFMVTCIRILLHAHEWHVRKALHGLSTIFQPGDLIDPPLMPFFSRE